MRFSLLISYTCLASALSIFVCKAQKVIAPIVLKQGSDKEGPILISYKNDFGDVVQLRFNDDNRRSGKNIIISSSSAILLELITTASPTLVYAKPGDTITISSANAGKKYTFKARGCVQHRVNFFGFLEDAGCGMGIPEYFNRFYTDSTYNKNINFAVSMYEKRMAILQEYAKSHCLEEDFKNDVATLIDLYYTQNLLVPYISPVDVTRYNLFPKSHLSLIYHSRLYQLLTKSESTLHYKRGALAINYATFLSKEYGKLPDDISSRYHYAVDSLQGKTRDYVLFFLMKKLLKESEGTFQNLYDNFQQDCGTSSYRAYIDSVSQMKRGIMALPSVLTTRLEDETGRKVSWGDVLDKNKGSVIYLDFWASWCGPCLAQMPFSKKIEAALISKPVSLVYLSVDDDKSKWRKTIHTQGLDGVRAQHYVLSSKSKLATYLGIPPIPHYIIIDQLGKVITLDATRPQDPATLKQLEALSQ